MNEKPIFIQLKEIIEDSILSDRYKAGDFVISSTQICRLYNVNPATAIRALSELASEEVLVKERGIGMKVTLNAKDIIKNRRKERFLNITLMQFVAEAQKLQIDSDMLVQLLKDELNNKSN